MAKTSGLNVRLYVAGNDLSGDANSLSAVGYTSNLYDTPTLDSDAMKRIIGNVDGTLSVSGWFDNRTGGIHPTFTSNSGKVPTADQNVLIPLGSAVGDPCYGLVSKETDYSIDRSDGGPISVASSFATNGYAPAFGVMLTAHDDSVGSAASGTAVDNGASSSNGGIGFVQGFSLTSGTVVTKIQHSTNNSSWTDLATFTSITGPTSEIVEVSGTVNRYIRYNLSGTFSTLSFAMGFSRS